MITNGINEPKDVCVGGGDMFVPNYHDDTVTIYKDVSTLVSGDGPDATLDTGSSYVHDPVRVAYHAGTLYVSNRDNSMMAFQSAATIVSSQTPDLVLGGPSELGGVRRPLISDNRLFIPNRWDDIGLSMFDGPLTLANGALPDATLQDPIDDVTAAGLIGGAILAYADKDDFLFAYFDADNIVTDQEPDLILWDPRMERCPELSLQLR